MMLPVVREQIATDRQAIAKAINENDCAHVKKASHRLKGSVGQIGAMRAKNACALLEAAAANDHSSDFVELKQKLETELDALIPEIDSFLANHPTNSH